MNQAKSSIDPVMIPLPEDEVKLIIEDESVKRDGSDEEEESVKEESVKQESVKEGSVKQESVKHESVKHESVKHESVKEESVKKESIIEKDSLNKTESLKIDDKSEKKKLNSSEAVEVNRIVESNQIDQSIENEQNLINNDIVNNQKNHSFNENQNQSLTSGERYTSLADNYVTRVFDKVLDDYPPINGSKSQDEHQGKEPIFKQDGSNNQQENIDAHASLEKRIDVIGSIEQSNINENQLENDSQTNKSSSTTRNLASDYVTGMIGGLY
jgi:hypothetical protein